MRTRLSLWPPYPLGFSGGGRRDSGPFPFDRDYRLYARARHGLWHGVRALGLGPGDVVLAPAYHQGAEIEAFVKAGLDCRYYDTDRFLRPESATLDALLSDRVKALHIIHYWGFPQNVRYWRDWCDERGLYLIEDGAQALLSSSSGLPAGARADLAVFCLYKSFGVPDGGVATCSRPIPAPRGRAPIGVGVLARKLGSALAQRNAAMAWLQGKARPLNSADRPFGKFLDGEFELGDPFEPPVRATSLSLPRVVDSRAADRRRENFAAMLESLGHLVPEPFWDLPDGAVPIAFPCEVESPRSLASYLAAYGVDSGFLWPTWHPTLNVDAYPVARRFRERVLALPVHQELSCDDAGRIAEATAAWSVRHPVSAGDSGGV